MPLRATTRLCAFEGGINRVLVRFDQQSLEQGIGTSSIRSAKLRLYVTGNGNNWGSDGREVDIHRLTEAWTEAGATWNCPNDTNTGNASPDCSPSWDMGGTSLPPFVIAPTHVILHHNNQTGWVEWLDPAIEKRISNVPAEPLTSEESAELKEAVRLEVGSLPPTAQNPPYCLQAWTSGE